MESSGMFPMPNLQPNSKDSDYRQFENAVIASTGPCDIVAIWVKFRQFIGQKFRHVQQKNKKLELFLAKSNILRKPKLSKTFAAKMSKFKPPTS